MLDEHALGRAVVAVSDDAIISTDRDGLVTSWNPAAERLYGIRASDIIGRSILAITTPDTTARDTDVVARALQGERTDNYQTIRRRADGTQIPVWLTVAPIRSVDGTIIGVLRIHRDRSHWDLAKRVGRRLAAIVESSDDAIISKDLDGTITSWNLAAERMFGYSAGEMIGTNIRRIIPADRQGEEDEVVKRIRTGDRVDHFETLRRRKDGSLIPISLTVSPILDDAGVVVGASKIARDVSEYQRLLRIAQDNQAAAENASRLKDEFLATLSHELRTPLNAILGYARMIRSGIVPAPRLGRALDTIERNATSLTKIVEDVLDVSRIVSGKMRLTLGPVSLAAIVHSAADAVSPAANAKGIRLDCEFDDGNSTISGDADRLQQIMWNLMSNAVKFTDRGGEIRVVLRLTASDAMVAVSDTGIGVAPDFLPHMFERFRQQDAGMARERGGLGLGLAIVRQLVEMHGGSVTAASPGIGRGATFTVTLPLMAAQRRESSQSPREPVKATSANFPHADLTGVHVLAVEDDRDSLEMLSEILETCGATVSRASSAPEALDLLTRMTPSVVIADIGLPHMDGFELIATVRRSQNADVRSVPAAALTAYTRSEDRARALRAGYQVHLAKPIDPQELLSVVAELAGRPLTSSLRGGNQSA